MKQLILSALLLSLIGCGGTESSSASNQSEEPKDTLSENNDQPEEEVEQEDLYYKGTINNKYEIAMRLSVPIAGQSGAVSGNYYYLSQKKPIILDGTLKDHHLALNEFVGTDKTGAFSGDFNDNRSLFSGNWSNEKNNFEFELEASGKDYYDGVFNGEITVEEPITWEELKNAFKKVELPAFTDGSEGDESQIFNEMTAKRYLVNDNTEWDEFGFNEFYPIMRFDYMDMVVLVVQHYYTPGVFGINNWFFNLYTFTKDGNPISSQAIGCNCNDTNMGANDYYSTQDIIHFNEDGSIQVTSEHTHATLFGEELLDGEEAFDERDTTITNYQIEDDGMITEVK